MSLEHNISVGLGKIVIAQSPAVIVAAGIGSCIIVCLYDSQTKTGAAAHIMLPYQNESKPDRKKPAKYADTAIAKIVRKLKKRGISPNNLVAKIVGGAQLFYYSQVPNIGEQNIRVVKRLLHELKIPIVGNLTGGHFGRSIWFHCDTGKVIVRQKFDNMFEI
ncbi:chemotaxis protein CheD [bacterium]|nr:MAG: chemotaxis protein CheD [bacterium]